MKFDKENCEYSKQIEYRIQSVTYIREEYQFNWKKQKQDFQENNILGRWINSCLYKPKVSNVYFLSIRLT